MTAAGRSRAGRSRPESDQAEAPAYLQAALRAAAAARARTARIRAGDLASNGAAEEPVEAAGPALEPTEGVRADLEWEANAASGSRAEAARVAPAERGRRARARKLSFARTVAAAHEARSAAVGEGAEDPWHLCLRAETDTQDGAWHWWSRLLKPLSLRRKSTVPRPELLSLGYEAAAAIQQPREPAGHSAAGADQPPLEGTWPRAGPTLVARREAEPAAAGILRLPRLGQRGFDPEGLPSGAPNAPGGTRSPLQSSLRWAPPSRAAPDDRRRGWRGLVDAGTRGPSGPAALAARWGSRLSAKGRPARHDATASAPPRSQSVVPVMAAEPGRHRLPSIVQRAGLPSLRLLAYEAGRASARAGSGWSRPGARPAPSADRRVARKRLAARLATLGFAIVGGFGLGIVANGGALLTGSKLGEAMLALEAHVFDRPAGAPPAGSAPQPGTPPPRAETGDSVRPPNPAPPLAATGASVAARSEGRETAAAASIVQSPPHAAAAKRPAGGVGASARESGRSEPTTAAAPGSPPAAASGWEALYAQGHRFQLQGNLVAAADAYRRAIQLNPHHPAMLYDLGYVLQMQGQTDVAMDYYRRTIALEPDHAYAHYNLGYLLQEQGNGAAASQHYEIAAARLPENPYIYYDWAWSLETAGDLAGAAALYRKAIEIDPDRRPGSDARRRLAALGLPARSE